MNQTHRALFYVSLAGIALAFALAPAYAADRIQITTKSDEARLLYLEARSLNENLRVGDARQRFQEAIGKDPDLALAYLGLAQTSATATEFFESVKHAVALSEKASEGERLMILELDAGVKSMPDAQRKCAMDLVKLYPDDERALGLLGNYYFGTQEYPEAITQYERAVAINPGYAPVYNQLGYAYRFTKDYPKAEQAFRKYIELIPSEPNPYDSLAEFLMKTGRFEESIQNYEKALEVDPNFVQSYVGIANDQIFLGRFVEARKTCDRMDGVARNVGEKRQPLFWKAVSYVHEGRPDDAIAAVRSMQDLAEKANDPSTVSGDLQLIGIILLESGKPDGAAPLFQQALEIIDHATLPKEVQDAAHRAYHYQQARVELAKKDVTAAKKSAEEYQRLVNERRVPFEVRQAHELAGRLALEEKNYDAAVSEFKAASQQDPRVLYLSALAYVGKKDMKSAAASCEEAAHFNGLNANYAYVRKPAMDMLARMLSQE